MKRTATLCLALLSLSLVTACASLSAPSPSNTTDCHQKGGAGMDSAECVQQEHAGAPLGQGLELITPSRFADRDRHLDSRTR